MVAFKMGMGKTLTMLETMHNGIKMSNNLVVCSKSNVKVWIDEIAKFKDQYPDFKYFVYHKDYNSLKELPDLSVYNIIITTYEVIRTQFKKANPYCVKVRVSNFYEPLQHIYPINNIPKNCTIAEIMKPKQSPRYYNFFYTMIWSRIIADESQRFSSVNSILARAMISLRAKNYYCLSGTPIVNYGSDLYSQFKFMGMELLVKDWKADYYNNNSLGNYVISKDFSDTNIKLPRCKMVDVKVEFSDMEKKMYNAVISMLKEKYIEFQRGTETFAAPLAMLTRLRQISLCPYIITKESKRPRAVGKNKIPCPIPEPALETIAKQLDTRSFGNLLKAYPVLYSKFKGKYWKQEIQNVADLSTEFFPDTMLNKSLNDNKLISHWSKTRKILKIIKRNLKYGKKIVVFSSFVSFLNVLQDKINRKNMGKVLQIDGSTKNRDEIVDEFNNGDANILLCSYKAGGVGINLTAAESLVLAEPWWNSATEKQAICRIHRIGQKKDVRIYSLIVDKSVEMHMLNIQEKKLENSKKYGLGDESYSRITGSIQKQVIENIVYGEYLS
jgi:SNF2 family DNA or RNA helicase